MRSELHIAHAVSASRAYLNVGDEATGRGIDLRVRKRKILAINHVEHVPTKLETNALGELEILRKLPIEFPEVRTTQGVPSCVAERIERRNAIGETIKPKIRGLIRDRWIANQLRATGHVRVQERLVADAR